MSTVSLSLAMIVKDEADCLGRCLQSVQGLVDQMLVVDTGSQDQTPELARQAGAEVINFIWTHDFAAARNASLQACTSDWILVLDADEYLDIESAALLKAYLQHAPAAPAVTELRMLHYDDQGQVTRINYTPRLFSRHPQIYFEKPFHEGLHLPENVTRQALHQIQIHHQGYAASQLQRKQKYQRDLAYLQQMKAREPGVAVWFCYEGDAHYAAQRYQLALDNYLPVLLTAELQLQTHPHLRLHLLCRAMRAYQQLGEVSAALALPQQLPWPLSQFEHPGFFYIQGLLLRAQHNYSAALAAFQRCLTFDGSQQVLLSYDPHEIWLYPLLQMLLIYRSQLFQPGLPVEKRFEAARHLLAVIERLLSRYPTGVWSETHSNLFLFSAEAFWLLPAAEPLAYPLQMPLQIQLQAWREQLQKGLPEAHLQYLLKVAQQQFTEASLLAMTLLRLGALHFGSLECVEVLQALLAEQHQLQAQQQIQEICLFLPAAASLLQA